MSEQLCFEFLKDIPADFFNGQTPQEVFDQLRSTIAQDVDNKDEIVKRLVDDILEKHNPDGKKIANWQHEIAVNTQVDNALRYENLGHGMIANYTGVFGKERKRRLSNAALHTSELENDAGSILQELREKKLYDYYINTKGTQDEIDIAEALGNLDSVPNGKARETARILKKNFEQNRELKNKYGANISELQDYRANQTHNIEKLIQPAENFKESMKKKIELYDAARKAGATVGQAWKDSREKLYFMARDRWKSFIKPLLNIERTYKIARGNNAEPMTDKSVDDMLNHVWDSLLSDVRGKISRKPVKISERIKRRRILHFKDGASWTSYNRKYGAGTLVDSVIHTMQSNAREYINLKNFGDDMEKTHQEVKKRLISLNKDDPFLGAKLNRSDKYFKVISGEDSLPHSYLGAKISSQIRMIQNMTKLSLVMLISLSDHAQAISALRSHGLNIFDRYSLFFKTYLSSTERGIRKQVADMLGITALHSLGAYQNTFAAADTPLEKVGKFQQLMFKLNGQTWFDNALRGGFATGISRNLARNANKEFERLDPKLQRTLEGYGIGKEEWDLVRSNKDSMKAVNGEHFITPDMAMTLDDDSLEKYLGRKPNKFDRETTKKEIQERLSTFFSDQTDLAQMRMGASERAMIYRGSQPGTVLGEAARFWGQFKFYGLGITRRAIGRIIKESHDSKDLSAGMADYMAAALAFGYLSTSAQSFVRNGSIPSPFIFQNYMNATIAGGGMGMFGSMMMGHYQDYGQSFVGDTLGPVAGTTDALAKLIYTLGDFSNEGKRTTYHQRALKQLTQFTTGHVLPGLALTKNVVTKQLYNQIMSDLNPGYQAQQQKNNQNNIQVLPFG